MYLKDAKTSNPKIILPKLSLTEEFINLPKATDEERDYKTVPDQGGAGPLAD